MQAVISRYGDNALHGLVSVIWLQLKAEGYIDIEFGRISFEIGRGKHTFVFQQDNEPKRKAKKITALCKSY